MNVNRSIRPAQATLLAALLGASGVFMLWLGTMATAYYVSGACLLLMATLLWRGRALKPFKVVLLANQLSAVLLLLLLMTPLAGWLHLPKLELAGVMLLLNLLTGGPLMGLWSMVLLGSMHFSRALPDWFGASRVAMPAHPLPVAA